jgi:hypothetical protein
MHAISMAVGIIPYFWQKSTKKRVFRPQKGTKGTKNRLTTDYTDYTEFIMLSLRVNTYLPIRPTRQSQTCPRVLLAKKRVVGVFFLKIPLQLCKFLISERGHPGFMDGDHKVF